MYSTRYSMYTSQAHNIHAWVNIEGIQDMNKLAIALYGQTTFPIIIPEHCGHIYSTTQTYHSRLHV